MCVIRKEYVWEVHEFSSIIEILSIFIDFRSKKSPWIFRGSCRDYDYKIIPSCDRKPFDRILNRKSKIDFERQSIELYRSTIKQFIDEEERNLLGQNITTLMLMQHYGAPTRLVDWSLNPYIAAYFAVCEDDDNDGLIWAFDYKQYENMGSRQWETFSYMRTGDCFDNTLSPAFQSSFEDSWFLCQFLKAYKFPRILAQEGLFTFCSQFNKDHALMIKNLFQGPEYHIIFRIRHEDKKELRQLLREGFNIWHGMIYPDSTGAAEAVKEVMRDRVADIR